MKKVKFVHHYGYFENEKDEEVIEFPEGTTAIEIQNEFEQFVLEKTADSFYWEEVE